mgnify:CR=1 FL=1
MINYYYASIFLLLIIKILPLQHLLPKKVSKYIIIAVNLVNSYMILHTTLI